MRGRHCADRGLIARLANSRIIIAGAGIAGLTAALSLARKGLTVTVLEAFDIPSEVGAGIQIAPNATSILRTLGVLPALEQKAVAPSSVRLADAISGQVLLDMPIDTAWLDRMGAPYLTAHRAHLHSALYDAAGAHPGIELLPGHRITSVIERADSVRLTVTTQEGFDTLEAPILIGADGIWSAVRDAVPGAAQPRPTGRVAWRAIGPASASGAGSVTAWMAPDRHVVTYPVRNSETLNIVAITRGRGEAGEWAQSRDTQGPSELFGNLHGIDANVSGRAKWTFWPLYSVDANSRWFSERIILIGDAAHGMEPFAAQGAAMAIEDGYALAACLEVSGDKPGQAFKAYTELRAARIARVSRRTAVNRWVYHQSGPGRLARNMFFAARSPASFLADLDWLYGYRVDLA